MVARAPNAKRGMAALTQCERPVWRSRYDGCGSTSAVGFPAVRIVAAATGWEAPGTYGKLGGAQNQLLVEGTGMVRRHRTALSRVLEFGMPR